MTSDGIKVVFGTGGIGNQFYPDSWMAADYIERAFDVLLKHGVNALDTAQVYGDSEKYLGELKAGDKFTIDTKWMGGFNPGNATKEKIVNTAKESIQKLGVKQVDVFYIHAPDATTDLEETLAGVNDVYKTGVFKRFGLSNYSANDTQKVYDICKKNGYVLPTVYQGNYSPVARRQETELFPTLRKLGIAFYAYSPLAGGFLTKTPQQVQDGAGRFDLETFGGLYRALYMKPSYLEALAKWEAIAKEEGVARAELAYRWVRYNSPLKKEHGDAIIIGASTVEQLEQTLVGIEKGPLSKKAVEAIDQVWEEVKHEAPLDNFTR